MLKVIILSFIYFLVGCESKDSQIEQISLKLSNDKSVLIVVETEDIFEADVNDLSIQKLLIDKYKVFDFHKYNDVEIEIEENINFKRLIKFLDNLSFTNSTIKVSYKNKAFNYKVIHTCFHGGHHKDSSFVTGILISNEQNRQCISKHAGDISNSICKEFEKPENKTRRMYYKKDICMRIFENSNDLINTHLEFNGKSDINREWREYYNKCQLEYGYVETQEFIGTQHRRIVIDGNTSMEALFSKETMSIISTYHSNINPLNIYPIRLNSNNE